MRFTVVGTKTIDVTFTIEAEDKQEARNTFDSTDCCVETKEDEVTVNSCCESTSEIDDVTCDAETKWDALSKSERMEMLKGNGASDDDAYTMAGWQFDDIPDEWQSYFD